MLQNLFNVSLPKPSSTGEEFEAIEFFTSSFSKKFWESEFAIVWSQFMMLSQKTYGRGVVVLSAREVGLVENLCHPGRPKSTMKFVKISSIHCCHGFLVDLHRLRN
ncbi:hypothetical protein P3X46_031535 [Hevea brasiliensis]|uniref:Uncharacterized protein n=1 Tax=Hevea brasiliensis TaxID=3981 RepID=A0ABQ9KKL6_HEVBR|nr:hypothetical protein P3X46_031535 [Hevea brasiliensis]